MNTAEKIQSGYIDYVLTNDGKPGSVYSFAKKLKISEAEFYEYFASFESIEKGIWVSITTETIATLSEQENWKNYDSREKILAFFYAYVEMLKKKRSFVIYSLGSKNKNIGTPAALLPVKEIFGSFSEGIIEEGLESGELMERKFLSKRYKDALWIQFVLIVKFWTDDDSIGFEKTDEAIERGINVTFDLFQRSPIDNLFEYGKFLTRNGKFREKMGL